MKIIKIIGIASLLLTLTLVLAIQLIDPNDYKSTIITQVKQATGRTLHIDGDITLSLFPRIRLTLGKTWLENTEGFTQTIFIQVAQAEAQIQILPLFIKQVVLEKIQLVDVLLNLERNAQGQGNWENLLITHTQTETNTNTNSSFSVTLQDTRLQQAQIHWQDAQNQQQYDLTQLQIAIGTFDYPLIQQTTPIQISTTLHALNVQTQLTLETQAQLYPQQQQYRLQPVNLNLTATGDAIPNHQQNLQLSTELFIDLAQEQLNIDTLQIKLLDNITLQLQLQTQQLFKQPQIKGKITLQPFYLKPVFQQLGLTITSDNPIFTQNIQASAELEAIPNQFIRIQQLQFALDTQKLNIPKIQLDTQKQQLQIPEITLQLFNLAATANLAIQDLLTQPIIHSELTIKPFELKKLLQSLNITPPELPYLPLKNTAFHLTAQGALQQLTINAQSILDDNNLAIQNLKLNLDDNSATLEQAVVNALGLRLTAQAQIKQLKTNPSFTSNLQLANFSPRDLLKRLTIPLYNTTDATVFNNADFSTQIQGDLQQLHVNNLNARIDQSRLQGTIDIQAWQPITGAFNLQIDKLNVDRYLSKPNTEKTSTTTSTLPELPLDLIQSLALKGIINIGELTQENLTLKNTSLSIE
ncbi:uncharacterized protein involved in outer membrane biogenesis [Beggiatoa alba B18LD]|uniref:Uncharacterized protein involved in outer membrane biogenesis n=1 Tax=Beggiatoa alba B18LD TaxID=395493 RepID=I3CHB6_9GAMM|nr:AsmA family protein [Beggiatoa alba]EIJ43009.1 uncharacterized protein involved in outer membrane biogenesis [Beggiatoa alba B18LD]